MCNSKGAYVIRMRDGYVRTAHNCFAYSYPRGIVVGAKWTEIFSVSLAKMFA